MSSSKLSNKAHLNSDVRLLLELYCVIASKHVAFFTTWAKLTVAFTLTSLSLNLYSSVFGLEQKCPRFHAVWWLSWLMVNWCRPSPSPWNYQYPPLGWVSLIGGRHILFNTKGFTLTCTISYLIKKCICRTCNHALSVFTNDSHIVTVELCDFARMKWRMRDW